MYAQVSTMNLLSAKNNQVKNQKNIHILRENLVEMQTDYTKFDILLGQNIPTDEQFKMLDKMDSI